MRKGELLLAGLLRCGHCGRKLHVAYSGTRGDVGRYHCRGAMINHGTGPCISFGSLRVDQAVGGEIVRVLEPLGIEAALQAIAARAEEAGAKRRQIELSLENARFEAARARRQYDAVDPDNRLVASELERRWNVALTTVKALEDELDAPSCRPSGTLSDEERQRLMAMGADLAAVWDHASATAATRKRILRSVLTEIVARVDEDRIELLLHWQGGDHTALTVRKNATGQHRWAAEPDTEPLIRALARLVPDKMIASLLNRMGRKTGRLNGWTELRVRSYRNGHGIAVYRDGERAARGEVTLEEAAEILRRSPVSVLRLIRTGVLPGRQHCKGTPWVINRGDVIAIAAEDLGRGRRPPPLSQNADQRTLQFQ